MPSLIENARSRTRKKTLKDWLILMDNARPHSSGELKGVSKRREPRACGIRVTVQTWPECLFFSGSTKGKHSDYDCERREDFLNAITEIFAGIDYKFLQSVGESWGSWLRWAAKHEGKYDTK
jgi:hypothetical protein